MTATLIEFAWYAALALIVAAALVGLWRRQIYAIRIRRRLDRRIRSLRRR